MDLFTSVPQLRAALAQRRRRGERIGLVPTMGNLHAGHLSLVEAALADCAHVVTSIFVNPMQFSPGEDYARYPRSFEQDRAQLEQTGCHTLFLPDVAEMYPRGLEGHTQISVPHLSELHCGASRPGHFTGVATVVCKLFNLVAPDRAYFGLKDYQQYLIVRRMAADLCLPVEVVGLPTRREPSGLALSSRNSYLSDDGRRRAAALHASLRDCASALEAGERDYSGLEQQAREQLEQAGLRVDYLSICQASSLLPATAADSDVVILGAVWLEDTRLIDNVRVKLKRSDT